MQHEIVYKRVDELIPYARNARLHSDDQVAQIAASIREFGFNAPVLIDGHGGIIAGHGRVMAARKLGLESVPTIALPHLSDVQKRAYILADNKLALNSGWDNEMLVSMMPSFDAAQYMGGAHGEIGDWELFFRKLLECA